MSIQGPKSPDDDFDNGRPPPGDHFAVSIGPTLASYVWSSLRVLSGASVLLPYYFAADIVAKPELAIDVLIWNRVRTRKELVCKIHWALLHYLCFVLYLYYRHWVY